MVLMSRKWIRHNLTGSASTLSRDMLVSYSRHLFYTLITLPASLEQTTALAAATASDARTHSNHMIHTSLHYDENAVRNAVNTKKANL